MPSHSRSAEIFRRNRRVIPGGVVSTNRAIQPEIVFVKGEGAYIWSADGERYIDYHAAFAPHILGHNDVYVNDAVIRCLRDGSSLFGSGTTVMEGRLAELMCDHIPFLDSVQFLNTGSEATYEAIRVARAATGRDHIIVTQGGYNGWHNDVACNLMTPLDVLGPRAVDEYAFHAISAGIPEAHRKLVHPINFNDLESVKIVCERYPVAGLITEPVLQNIGVVPPAPGYLAGLRQLADRYGFVLVFDEVKTGFRHAFGGYASLSGVAPDLAVYGKALANGYPIAAIGGKQALMDYFVHPDPARRVLLAGTYNGHPVPTAAAIATLERLLENNGEVYAYMASLGRYLEEGLQQALSLNGHDWVISRIGSAFCIYFMNHLPADWHDLAGHHDFALDNAFRAALIRSGIYFFPLATKQCSISAAHTRSDVDQTIDSIVRGLNGILEPRAAARI
ncbi:MAG: aspartate aminotransferase family protein [Acidobacteria bacterium]|nr:aspartate aminotransferase family protein [Acidobacteriota bacterium]